MCVCVRACVHTCMDVRVSIYVRVCACVRVRVPTRVYAVKEMGNCDYIRLIYLALIHYNILTGSLPTSGPRVRRQV